MKLTHLILLFLLVVSVFGSEFEAPFHSSSQEEHFATPPLGETASSSDNQEHDNHRTDDLNGKSNGQNIASLVTTVSFQLRAYQGQGQAALPETIDILVTRHGHHEEPFLIGIILTKEWNLFEITETNQPIDSVRLIMHNSKYDPSYMNSRFAIFDTQSFFVNGIQLYTEVAEHISKVKGEINFDYYYGNFIGSGLLQHDRDYLIDLKALSAQPHIKQLLEKLMAPPHDIHDHMHGQIPGDISHNNLNLPTEQAHENNQDVHNYTPLVHPENPNQTNNHDQFEDQDQYNQNQPNQNNHSQPVHHDHGDHNKSTGYTFILYAATAFVLLYSVSYFLKKRFALKSRKKSWNKSNLTREYGSNRDLSRDIKPRERTVKPMSTRSQMELLV